MSQVAHFYLVHRSLKFRSTTAQKCGCFFNCLPVRTINQMRVVIKRDPRIGVTELSLRDLGCGAGLEKNRGMHVPEGMKARAGNFQCIAQRP